MTTNPIQALPSPGVVALVVDAETARQIADAWEFAHSLGALDDDARPTYLLDSAAIRRAAVEADILGSDDLPVQLVPVEVPRLRLVGGESA